MAKTSPALSRLASGHLAETRRLRDGDRRGERQRLLAAALCAGVLFLAGAALLHRGYASSANGIPATAENAHTAYRMDQHAVLDGDFGQAARFFEQSRRLSPDADRQAWALYREAVCEEARTARRSQADGLLRDLIRRYPRRYLADRAQVDLDRLEGRTPQPAALARLDVDRGPECLAHVMASFGMPADVAELHRLACAPRRDGGDAGRTGQPRITLAGLREAASASGLHSEGMQADLVYLRQLDRPAILVVQRTHFVAYMGAAPGPAPGSWQAIVFDPDANRALAAAGSRDPVDQAIDPRSLERKWDGCLLALSPGPSAAAHHWRSHPVRISQPAFPQTAM